jgi:hypothetical protein
MNRVLIIIILVVCFPCLIYSSNLYTEASTVHSKIRILPDEVKGIHITIGVASNIDVFKRYLRLADRTEINAMVIDVKETDGIVAYDSNVRLAKQIGVIQPLIDIPEIIALCNKHRLYKIARICVFKDQRLALRRPDLAIKDRYGRIWRDFKRRCWVNPYSREVWEYALELGKELLELGFNEIQYDYVRFPTDGKISHCRYGRLHNRKTAVEAITEFVKFCKQGLKDKGYLSVDVFGLTINQDIGIGQDFRKIAEYVDFISPMVYPSHYYRGEYGLPDPDAQPYEVVAISTAIAKRKLKGTNCKLRSWLQDFSLRHWYGPVEVRLQIKALADHGCNSWLLWNPNCRYTEEALMPDEAVLLPEEIDKGNFYIPAPPEEELLRDEVLMIAGLSTLSYHYPEYYLNMIREKNNRYKDIFSDKSISIVAPVEIKQPYELQDTWLTIVKKFYYYPWDNIHSYAALWNNKDIHPSVWYISRVSCSILSIRAPPCKS